MLIYPTQFTAIWVKTAYCKHKTVKSGVLNN